MLADEFYGNRNQLTTGRRKAITHCRRLIPAPMGITADTEWYVHYLESRVEGGQRCLTILHSFIQVVIIEGKDKKMV